MKSIVLEVYQGRKYLEDKTIRDIETNKQHLDNSLRFRLSTGTGEEIELVTRYGHVIGLVQKSLNL